MANEIVEALKDELTSHGVTQFREEFGGKHHRLYFVHNGVERFHIVSGSPGDRSHKMLAIQDVRRMIGVNQGSGPGARRTKQPRAVHRTTIAPPPDRITVMPDPMAALEPLRNQLREIEMSETIQVEVHADPVPKRVPVAKPAAPELPTPTGKERGWLSDQFKRGERERFTLAKTTVTPGLAAAMLEHNTANRRINKAQLALQIGRLKRGNFILTHQGLAFAKSAALLDGQHRLLAVAQSGVSAPFMITFGAAQEEFTAIDTGRSRQAADLVGIKGLDQPALRSSVARVLLIAGGGATRPDVQFVLEKALEVAEDPRMVIALHLGKAMPHGIAPTPVAAAYYWIATHSPKAMRVNEFFDGLPAGENLAGVRLRLREWLRDTPKPQKIGSDRNLWLTAGIILAWNSWVRDKRVLTLTWTKSGELPDPL